MLTPDHLSVPADTVAANEQLSTPKPHHRHQLSRRCTLYREPEDKAPRRRTDSTYRVIDRTCCSTFSNFVVQLPRASSSPSSIRCVGHDFRKKACLQWQTIGCSPQQTCRSNW